MRKAYTIRMTTTERVTPVCYYFCRMNDTARLSLLKRRFASHCDYSLCQKRLKLRNRIEHCLYRSDSYLLLLRRDILYRSRQNVFQQGDNVCISRQEWICNHRKSPCFPSHQPREIYVGIGQANALAAATELGCGYTNFKHIQ